MENHEKQCRWIFRTWRRHPKTGEKLYAKDYGLRAWRIPIVKSNGKSKNK